MATTRSEKRDRLLTPEAKRVLIEGFDCSMVPFDRLRKGVARRPVPLMILAWLAVAIGWAGQANQRPRQYRVAR